MWIMTNIDTVTGTSMKTGNFVLVNSTKKGLSYSGYQNNGGLSTENPKQEFDQ